MNTDRSNLLNSDRDSGRKGGNKSKSLKNRKRQAKKGARSNRYSGIHQYGGYTPGTHRSQDSYGHNSDLLRSGTDIIMQHNHNHKPEKPDERCEICGDIGRIPCEICGGDGQLDIAEDGDQNMYNIGAQDNEDGNEEVIGNEMNMVNAQKSCEYCFGMGHRQCEACERKGEMKFDHQHAGGYDFKSNNYYDGGASLTNFGQILASQGGDRKDVNNFISDNKMQANMNMLNSNNGQASKTSDMKFCSRTRSYINNELYLRTDIFISNEKLKEEDLILSKGGVNFKDPCITYLDSSQHKIFNNINLGKATSASMDEIKSCSKVPISEASNNFSTAGNFGDVLLNKSSGANEPSSSPRTPLTKSYHYKIYEHCNVFKDAQPRDEEAFFYNTLNGQRFSWLR